MNTPSQDAHGMVTLPARSRERNGKQLQLWVSLFPPRIKRPGLRDCSVKSWAGGSPAAEKSSQMAEARSLPAAVPTQPTPAVTLPLNVPPSSCSLEDPQPHKGALETKGPGVDRLRPAPAPQRPTRPQRPPRPQRPHLTTAERHPHRVGLGCTQHGQHGVQDGRQEGHHAEHCKRGTSRGPHCHPHPACPSLGPCAPGEAEGTPATCLELLLHSLGLTVELLGHKEPRPAGFQRSSRPLRARAEGGRAATYHWKLRGWRASARQNGAAGPRAGTCSASPPSRC